MVKKEKNKSEVCKRLCFKNQSPERKQSVYHQATWDSPYLCFSNHGRLFPSVTHNNHTRHMEVLTGANSSTKRVFMTLTCSNVHWEKLYSSKLNVCLAENKNTLS